MRPIQRILGYTMPLLPDSGAWPARAIHARDAKVRLQLQIDLRYLIDDPFGADFIFNLHAAHTPRQLVLDERLLLSQPLATRLHTDPASGNRLLRLHAEPGELRLSYSASVELHHRRTPVDALPEVPVQRLPDSVLPYLYPSRYCPSDQLMALARAEFGGLCHGHARVLAIQHWVQRQVRFTPNTSTSSTSALDTLAQRTGVCRDFAHLMIALCRALNIPARFATGTDFGADPALGPPDFHAYVEVFLGDAWYLFDPSGTAIPMGFVRIGTGRDAADVAFATLFGAVRSDAPIIRTQPVVDPAHNLIYPMHCSDALSTAAL